MHTLEIRVLSGVSAGDVFTYRLSPGESVQIGRADSNNLVLNDPRISRTHCGLLAKEDGVYIYDLGSAAGTIHMGFTLKQGEQGARRVEDGDEFKIGDSLFRLSVETDSGLEVTAAGLADGVAGTAAQSGRRRRFILIGAAACAIVLLMFAFAPGGKKPGLPKQNSEEIIELPSFRLLGYWPGGSRTPKDRKDNRHLDKVQFRVPGSHQLIEYEYIAEVPIEVYLGGVQLDTLEPYKAAWRRMQIVARDVSQGTERLLVFDNPEYPGKNAKRYKRWAVRNVRVTPFERELDTDVSTLISDASALTAHVDKAQDGLFLLIRSLRRLLLELLIEQRRDAYSIAILREAHVEEFDSLDAVSAAETLNAITSERLNDFSPETEQRHLEAVASLVSTFDGELWRRVDARMRQAKYSADANNHLKVYDNLMSIRAMFPDEDDYRWIRATRMLNDKKYVPKKILKNPDRYRR